MAPKPRSPLARSQTWAAFLMSAIVASSRLSAETEKL